MQAYRYLYHELLDAGCDLSTMPVELGTEDEVEYANEYLRQRVRSCAQDALQRKDLESHEHWLDVLQGAGKEKKCHRNQIK